MNTTFYRLFVLISLLTVLGGCATTTLSPQDCPAGTQKLADCPPIGAIEDSDIKKLYAERSWEFSKDLQVDPFVFGRDEAIPVNDAMTKFVGSTDDGAHSALAARIWMIENATHTIDVQYYIFRDDLAGRAMLGALCNAVRRGVDVRFMVDSLGSSTLKKKYLKALGSCALDAGFIRNANGETTVHKARVQVAIFNATSVPFSNPNRRSHDKLIVIDGRFPGKSYAITGGRNMSLDYFGILEDGSPNHHSYRDADILVRGPVNANPEVPPFGLVVETYYSILFLFEKNDLVELSAMSDPAKAYYQQRESYRDSLVALKGLASMREQFDGMNAYMTEGFYASSVLLAHELANVINKHVVTKAEDNLAKSPNSIINILGRLGEGDYRKVQIVSPYLFAAQYKEDGKVVVDDAETLLKWLDGHPDSSVEIVTNSSLTSDNFMTQSVIDMDLVPRLLMSEAMREQWTGSLEHSELDPEFVESEEWLEIVNHPRLAIYETGKLDDVSFGGHYHHSKLHAKYIIGDDIGYVGTSNFDYRSRLYNNEMGFFFRSEELANDIAKNTDYLISLSYRWGSPEWLEMRQRLRDMSGTKASTVRNQRDIYKSIKSTGLIWLF